MNFKVTTITIFFLMILVGFAIYIKTSTSQQNLQLAKLQQDISQLKSITPVQTINPEVQTQYKHLTGKMFSFDYPSNAILPAYNPEGFFLVGNKSYQIRAVGTLNKDTNIEDYIATSVEPNKLSDYTKSTANGATIYTRKKELAGYLLVKGHIFIFDVHDGNFVSQKLKDPVFQRLLSSLEITI